MASLLESSAADLAQTHVQHNFQALETSQLELASFQTPQGDVEWVFGRDGALTARIDGRWLSGCSLPRRTAGHLLRKLELRGGVGCFLHPTHAQQLAVVLEKLRPDQSLIAVVEDEFAFHWMLRCVDFSEEIRRGRLWFAVGGDWPARLRQLLETNDGLPVADQFIRTGLSDAQQVRQSIDLIRPLFEQEAQRRSQRAADLRRQWTENRALRTAEWCILAGSSFHLWHGAAARLWEQLKSAPGRWVRYDPDQPAAASSLALGQAAMQCDGIVSADLARANFPRLLPMEMPWITWVTRGHIPPAAGAGPKDRLLLADPAWLASARAAGWDEGRLGAALWPRRMMPMSAGRPALIVNTRPIDPEPEMDLSSHRLLWQAIAAEIEADPLVVAQSGGEGQYLAQCRARMDISDIGFDVARFINHLIRPAYHQSLARRLIERDWPLDLWGGGWGDIGAFAPHARGPVTDHAAFISVVGQASVLVHPEIDASFRHEIDSLGRPVMRPLDHGIGTYRRNWTQSSFSDAHPFLNAQSLPVL